MAGSRLLVHADVHDELVARLVARADTIKLGDPADADTEIGPLANAAQQQKVLGYLQSAVADGATVACGGGPDPELGGYFVRPTVLTDVKPDMRVVCEEIFGPVLTVQQFTTEMYTETKAVWVELTGATRDPFTLG